MNQATKIWIDGEAVGNWAEFLLANRDGLEREEIRLMEQDMTERGFTLLDMGAGGVVRIERR